MTRETGPASTWSAPTIGAMADHHFRGEDSPLYGSGPGAAFPAPGPYSSSGWPPPYPRPDTGLAAYGAGAEQPTGPTASPHASSRSEHFLGLLDQLGDQLNELGRTVAALADECAPDDQPATAEPGGQVDLTRWDHLVENTPKDDPYGADADLRAPAQTWNGAPER